MLLANVNAALQHALLSTCLSQLQHVLQDLKRWSMLTEHSGCWLDSQCQITDQLLPRINQQLAALGKHHYLTHCQLVCISKLHTLCQHSYRHSAQSCNSSSSSSSH